MNNKTPTIPRGQISILAGASGAGKTTLLLQAIASWSRGETYIPEFTWDGTSLAYVAADRPIKEVLELAEKARVDREKVEFYSIVDDLKLPQQTLDSPKALFKQYIPLQFKRPFDVLVIDPIGIFIDGSINNYQQVAKTLIPMNQFACQKDMTIIATHHARKARTDFKYSRPQDRISGSSAFLGYSGAQMVLVPAAEEGDEVAYDRLFVIPHTMPSMEVWLYRGQDGFLYPQEVGVPEAKVDPQEEFRLWKEIQAGKGAPKQRT